MRNMMLSIAAAAALLPFTGCCSGQKTSEVARAQGPAPAPAMAQGEENCDDVYFVPTERTKRCRFCQGHGCRRCCRPYHVPSDLVYPPQPDLPAIVQYPYYTCKGPDCFFAPPLPGR